MVIKILVGLQFQFKRGDLVLIKAASGKGKNDLNRIDVQVDSSGRAVWQYKV